MISVYLELDRRDRLRAVRAGGHAGLGAAGNDPACAAVTVLLRTAARLLAEDRRFTVDGRADAPGELAFSVTPRGLGGRGKLAEVTRFVERGLADVQAEYPEALEIDHG